MYIRHETDVPYVIVDKYESVVKIKLDIQDSSIERVFILYGDSYDYANYNDKGWNYEKKEMRCQYQTGHTQVWRVNIDIPKWRRLKYSFLLLNRRGEIFLYNEYGCAQCEQRSLNEKIDVYYSHFFFPYIFDKDCLSYPAWAKDMVWYQIFPDRFCEEGLDGIIKQLNYLEELGINGIYMTPVFKANSYHKYDTTDYFCIDPAFGTNDSLKMLVDEAHRRGIRVILDGVFNHMGSHHPFWQDVLEKQEKSAYKDFFCIRQFPVDSSAENSRELSYETFSFVAAMPKLNYENVQVREYVHSIIEFWIKEYGIDGWRFDVGNELSFCFYHELKERLQKIRDDIYLVAEIWHDPNRWFRNGYVDATMNYSLCTPINDYCIRQTIDGENFNERYFQIMNRLSPIHSQMSLNMLDSHDTIRVMSLAEGSRQKVKNAFTMLFMFPGAPCIYYGTEIGLAGLGDPDNRRPMIWDADLWDNELLTFFKGLIAFRRTKGRILQEAAITFMKKHYCDIWIFKSGQEMFLLVHNCSGQNMTLIEEQVRLNTGEQINCLIPDGMAVLWSKESDIQIDTQVIAETVMMH